MNTYNASRAGNTDHLIVVHKAYNESDSLNKHLHEAVIQTDLHFNITAWNKKLEELHGYPAIGKNLFEIIEFSPGMESEGTCKEFLLKKGTWRGGLSFKGANGTLIPFNASMTFVWDTANKPVAIMIIGQDHSMIREKELQLEAVEKKYDILMNTLPQGVMMIDKNAIVTACNKRGAEILGLPEEQMIGMEITDGHFKATKPDGSSFPFSEFPAIVSLQTGFPQRNVVMGIQQPHGMRLWISVNSEALIRPGEFDPYAVVISYTDITDAIFTEQELKKSNERFYYASQITSDAIWDLDLDTKAIYRSEAFSRFSGYNRDEINATLDWWFNMIHPDDRERVKNKLADEIKAGSKKWEDEYRFQCADGQYKFLFDSGIILYRNSKPVRILGAIRDLTDKKKLEKQLLDEQAQRHKAITQATMTAQEQEKANISRELHDNVNQILMSAKLFMDTAKRTPDQVDELIDKAIEYQLLALQEIRKLSKTLSTSHIKTVGLRDSVNDIVQNMKLLNLEVHFIFNNQVERILSHDQRLMLYRIIQEQTSNIIKYAEAKTVQIMINELNDMVHLVISDDGKGFDPVGEAEKGIGFINITSRAEAYNGTVSIISSPGKGCSLELCFPVKMP